MENSDDETVGDEIVGEETGNSHKAVSDEFNRVGIDRRKAVPPGEETAFTKFERLERRKQIVPGFVGAVPTGDKSSSDSTETGSETTGSEDSINPMLRIGSPTKPDQEHKKP